MEAITSRQNKVVREAAELLSSAGERRKRRQFLCEGARLCEDAARSGVEILRCFVTEGAREKYAHYLQPVLAASGESYRIADHVAGLLSSTKHPQGVFCQCRWPRSLQEPPVRRETSCAVLEGLQATWALSSARQRRWGFHRCAFWGSAATPSPLRSCGLLWGRCSA